MNVTRDRNNSRKHCNNSGWPQKDSAEHEEYAGALTGSRITENNITNADRPEGGMLEEILSLNNLNQAYKRVKKNKGAGGVDGMKVEELLQYLKDNGEEIRQTIKDGKYRPQPVRRVEIPKENGKKRKLGIPTVADRVAQMVVKIYFEPTVEPYFHPDSYGYRPGKSAIDALAVTRQRCWRYDWVLEFDIKGLFDNIDHQLLMKAVRKHTDNPWVIIYIQRWLTAPFQMPDGTIKERTKGTPQGGL